MRRANAWMGRNKRILRLRIHCVSNLRRYLWYFYKKPLKVINLWGGIIFLFWWECLILQPEKERCAKNRYETFAQHIDGFDALAHGGLPERGYYRHALPSLWQGDWLFDFSIFAKVTIYDNTPILVAKSFTNFNFADFILVNQRITIP